MIVLSWDTSGASQSAAVTVDGTLRGEIFRLQNPSHSESLLLSLETVLRESGIKLPAVDLFAVTVGPGSFTGLRTGIAVLKAFGRVWGTPVAPVSTLEALSEPWREGGDTVVSCLDARLSEVFVAVRRGSECSEERTAPVAAFAAELAALPGKKILLGSGALAHRGLWEAIAGVEIPADPVRHCVSAGAVGRIGAALQAAGRAVATGKIAPRYLRATEAERRLARPEKA